MKELISVSPVPELAVPEPPVVVGLDGSTASAAALAWAAGEAGAHRAPLLVVHVLDPRGRSAVYAPVRPKAVDDANGVLARIEYLVDHAVTGPVGPVEQAFEIGVPSVVLMRRAHGARMLVLGHSVRHQCGEGEEYRPGPVLGAIARACVAHADCPVVVVPEPGVGKKTASASTVPSHRASTQGARALHPFQGRRSRSRGDERAARGDLMRCGPVRGVRAGCR
jgi:nucleotide-binding universal stress UspA family protein